MSVPEGKRDIEELTVITKGRSFVARTIRICGNEKHFAKRLRWDFTQNIPKLAVHLYACCRKANRVYVECQADAQMRLGFWKEAYQSWKANAKQGTTYAVLRRMDSYYYVARWKFYA